MTRRNDTALIRDMLDAARAAVKELDGETCNKLDPGAWPGEMS